MRTDPSARFVLLAACLGVVGCQGQKPPPQAPPPPAVSVLKPVTYPVQGYYEYNGYLESVETVQIKARVKGYLEKVHFKEGIEVEKGADLYTIDPREFEAMVAKAQADIERAKADNLNARAQIKLAQAELKRQTDLGTAAAQTDKDKAAANVSAYEAQLQTAIANEHAGDAALRTARLELEFTRIKAPIGGLISRTLVTQGNLVGQNESTLLTSIVRLDELYVYFDAAERDLVEYLRRPQDPASGSPEAAARVEVGVAKDLGFPYTGTIDFRENKVDTGTGTVRIRGLLKNPAVGPGKLRQLYPGLYAKARVPSGPKRDLPVIPEEALMTGQEGRYVYVVDEKNLTQKRTVTVAPQTVWKVGPPGTDAGPPWMVMPPAEPPKMPDGSPGKPYPPKAAQSIVAIESGLTVNDRIIVNGLQKVVPPGRDVNPELWTLQPPAEKK